MRLGGSHLLLLGLGLGLAVGWLASDLVREDRLMGIEPSPLDRPSAPPSEAPPAPRLVARARPADAAPDAAGSRERLRARVEAEGLSQLRVFEGVAPNDGGLAQQSLPALATLYALAGQEKDLLRLAERAQAAGLPLAALFGAIEILPPESRVRVLDALHAHRPAFDLAPVALARLYLGAEAPDRAVAIAEQGLADGAASPVELLGVLVEADPASAVSFLLSCPDVEAWPGEHFHPLYAALEASGRAADLLPVLRRRLDAHPEDAVAGMLLAGVDPVAALGYARTVVERNPDDPSAWSTLGSLQMQAGDAAAAFEAYREAASRSPTRATLDPLRAADNARAIPLMERLLAGSSDDEAIGSLALAYEEAGQSEKAMRAFMDALAIDPTDGEWLGHLTQLDPERALALLREQAGPSLEAASDEVIGNMARAHRAAGRTAEAFDHYRMAHEKDPSDPEWQREMVDLDPDRALALLESRTDAVSQGALGRAYRALGREREAIDAFVRAIDGGDGGSTAELATLAPEVALGRMRAAVSARPNDDELWGDLGDLLVQVGRREEARQAYERARQLDPGDAEWTQALSTFR